MTCTLPANRVTLPMEPTAAKKARDFLAELCCNRHEARVLEDAQLLVSELVGNAVRHGAPPIELEVRCAGGDALQVRVRDAAAGGPTPRAADADAEGGRGLALVDLLSDAWGTEPEPDGKAVWFCLEVP
jgi:anti-sigma regulatory factor (Ser/Thr protein kinase)